MTKFALVCGGLVLWSTTAVAQPQMAPEAEVLHVFDELCAAPAIRTCVGMKSDMCIVSPQVCFKGTWNKDNASGIGVTTASDNEVTLLATRFAACLAAVKVTSQACWRKVPTQRELQNMVDAFQLGITGALDVVKEATASAKASQTTSAPPAR